MSICSIIKKSGCLYVVITKERMLDSMKRFYKGKVFFGTLALLGAVLLGRSAVATADDSIFFDGGTIVVTKEEVATLLGEDYPSNEELFAQYVDMMFYGALNEPVVNETARNQLTEPGKAIYDALKPVICKIARGEETSTVIMIDEATCAEWEQSGCVPKWTAEELGIEKITGENVQTVWDERVRPLFRELVRDGVWEALMHDCPYEMYWQDKVKGISYGPGLRYNESAMWITSFTIYFEVAQNYRPAGAADKTYITDATKTAATSDAVQNALAIVAEHQTETDYGKLQSYCDEIQDLSTYNDDAAKPGYTEEYGYGDPWQLIYVFDGDPATKVVCEGFSKAFQYLCDASDFYNDKVACYTVTGEMNRGAHMWNTVTMGDGKNYLLDVTNHTGSYQNLFLVGTAGSVANGYPFIVRNGTYTINFEYSDESKLLWGTSADSILTLAASNYPNTHIYPEHWTVESEPTASAPGVLTKTCTLCGDVQEKELPFLKIEYISLYLQSNLSFNYKIPVSVLEESGYENPYVVCKYGTNQRVLNYKIEDGNYVFSFHGIAPHCMTDVITATVYAEYDGKKYEGKTTNYSVTTYCYSALPIVGTSTRTMIVDLLNYGAAAQIYKGYNTTTLANASLTSEMAAYASPELSSLKTVAKSELGDAVNPTVEWKTVGLEMGDAVRIRYGFTTNEPISDLTVKIVSESGMSWTIPSSQFTESDGVYYVRFKGLNAAQMSEPVYATVYKGTSAVSKKMCYSVESYVKAWESNTDVQYTALKDLLFAMMKYGNAAYSYKNGN